MLSNTAIKETINAKIVGQSGVDFSVVEGSTCLMLRPSDFEYMSNPTLSKFYSKLGYNIVLLFLVSIEPYFFDQINLGPNPTQYQLADLEYASVLFALDIAGLMAIMAFFTHILTKEEKKLVSPELIRKYRMVRNSFFLEAALFLLSALPQFWAWKIQDTPFRFYFWLVPIGIFSIRRFFENETK